MLKTCTTSGAKKFSQMILLILLPIMTIGLTGCGSSSQENIVAKIGSANLPLKEYEKQFMKNNGGKKYADTASYETRKDFLDLLI